MKFLNLCKLTLTTFCLLSMTSGCENEDDDSSSGGNNRDFAFENTVAPEDFPEKLDQLISLKDKGDIVSTDSSDTNQIIAALQGTISSQDSGCENLISIFGMGGQTPEPAEFRLQEGASCSNAVESIKSFYSQALKSLAVQAGQLQSIKPGAEVCGMRATKKDVDSSKAAIAYSFSPYEKMDNMRYEHSIYGAATDTKVSIGTDIKIVVYGDNDNIESLQGIDSYNLSGRLETSGDLENETLSFNNAFSMSLAADNGLGGQMSISTKIASQANIEGLNDQEKFLLKESSTYEFSIDQGGDEQREHMALSLDLTIEEMESGQLKLSGHSQGHDELGTQDFEIYLTRDSYGCQISLEPNTDDFDPDTDPGPGTGSDLDEPDSQVERIEKSEIIGSWETPWDYGGELYQYQSKLVIAEDNFSLDTQHSSDRFDTDQENYIIHFGGAFNLDATELYNSTYSNERFIGINLTISEFSITPLSTSSVDKFNDAEYCGLTDWALNTAKMFNPGDCDLEESIRPYRTIGLEPNAEIMRLSEVSYFSGATRATRANFESSSSGLRFLKSQ